MKFNTMYNKYMQAGGRKRKGRRERDGRVGGREVERGGGGSERGRGKKGE